MENLKPKPFVFVLMPFDKEFEDVYHLGIKPACNNAGAYAERVDEQLFGESILDRIYNQISKADVIVADMSGRNPNVFYEVGYAHALGKNVILLTKCSDDIPFDLKHYPHIIYESSIKKLLSDLEQRLGWAIEHPVKTASVRTVEFYVNGQNLSAHPTLSLSSADWQVFGCDFKLSAKNSIAHKAEIETFKIGLLSYRRGLNVYYNDSSEFYNFSSFDESSDQTFYMMQKEFTLLPGEWASIPLGFSSGGQQIALGESIAFILRKLSDKGIEDSGFTIIANAEKS